MQAVYKVQFLLDEFTHIHVEENHALLRCCNQTAVYTVYKHRHEQTLLTSTNKLQMVYKHEKYLKQQNERV